MILARSWLTQLFHAALAFIAALRCSFFCSCAAFTRTHRGEMVGLFTKIAGTRQGHRSKHQYFLVESVGRTRISPAAALHGVAPRDTFEAVEHPAEPIERDRPVLCPPPESSIIQVMGPPAQNSLRLLDGLIWRERVASSFRRQIERNSTWQAGDVTVGRSEVISNPGRPDHGNLREKNLFVAHSAPELVVSRLVEKAA